jgi:hypothetical protein
VRGLLEGRNYLEIAKKRGTSTRTVANQLAAAFRRLGVSGRASLLNHIVSSPEVFAWRRPTERWRHEFAFSIVQLSQSGRNEATVRRHSEFFSARAFGSLMS